MVDELTQAEKDELREVEQGFADLYKETPYDERGDVEAYPIAPVEGDPAVRGMLYMIIAGQLYDDIVANRPIQVTDDQLAVLIHGVMRDGDATDFLAEQGVFLPQPADIGTNFYTNGHRDKAILTHQIWSTVGKGASDPVGNTAIAAAATVGIGTAASVLKYGFMATLKALPILAAWQSRGAATSGTPALARLVQKLTAGKAGQAVSATQAAVMAGRGMLYGKLPTMSVGYVNGIERYITSASARALLDRAVAGNFLYAGTNEAIMMAANYSDPEGWDEADRIIMEEALQKEMEAIGVMYADEEIQNDMAQLGMVVDNPAAGPQASDPTTVTTWADERNAAFQSYLGAPQQSGMAGQPGQAPTGFGGPMPGEMTGMGNIVQDDRVVKDAWGNIVSIDFEAFNDPGELQAVLEATAYNPAEDDPLIGVPQNYVAAPGSAQVAYDEYGDALRQGATGYDRRGPSGTMAGSPGGQYRPGQSYTGAPTAVPAEYRGSHAQDTVFNMTPAQLERFQNQAIRAGLINPADATFIFGSHDQQTMDAMVTIMGHANSMGRSWQSAAQIMGNDYQAKLREAEENEPKAIKPLFVPSAPYQSLDPETTRQALQADIERQLGRSANDWEMADFASYMEANHRSNYDSQVAAERAIWEARGRAALGEDPGALPKLELVDEQARYEAKFEERYEDELEETGRWDRMKQDTNTLFRSFDNISNQLGGV